MAERTDAEATEILEGIQWQILRQTGRIVGGQQVFEDAQQEALLAAWTRLREGHPVSIAMHNAKQAVLDVARGYRMTGSKSHGGHVDTHRRAQPLIRKSTLAEEYEIEPQDPRPVVDLHRIDLQDELGRLLGGLPARDREFLRLHYIEGLTHREIGERYGITAAGVSYAIKRCLEKVRAAA